MVQLAYSLRFAPPTSSHYRPTQTPAQILQAHCNHISTRYGCQAVLTPIDAVTLKRPSQHCDYNLTITGPAAQVVAARGDLIRDNPLLVRTCSRLLCRNDLCLTNSLLLFTGHGQH